LISKELRKTSALKRDVSEKAPLPFAPFADALGKRDKKELNDFNELEESLRADIRRG
jgi:hypothetical protein